MHKTSGRKKRCNFWLSKVYPWGDDDGIVQSKNAIIWNHARGVDDWEPYCHDDASQFLYDFSGKQQPIYNVLCNDSFLYELGACRED